MGEQTHRSIINGKVNRKLYYFYQYMFSDNASIHESHESVKEEPLWEGYLSLPVMEVGDKIYVTEIDENVQITGVIRTTENLYIYSTSHQIKLIEDEVTEKSKVRAEEALEYFQRLRKEEKPSKQPWYKKLFK